MIGMPGRSYRGPLPAETAELQELSSELEVYVTALAGSIGARNAGYPKALDDAAVYLEETLADLGYEVERQTFIYPVGALGLVYPTRGNFVAFVGDPRSRGLVRESIDVFREHAQIGSEGAALPEASPAWDGPTTGRSGKKGIRPSWSLTRRPFGTPTITPRQIHRISSTTGGSPSWFKE